MTAAGLSIINSAMANPQGGEHEISNSIANNCINLFILTFCFFSKALVAHNGLG